MDNALEEECNCHKYRVIEEEQWKKLGKQARDAHDIWKQQGCEHFFTQQPTIEPTVEKGKDERGDNVEHELFPLSKTLSNMGSNQQVIGIIKDGPECKLREEKEWENEEDEEIRVRRTMQFNLEDFKQFKEGARER